MSVNEMQTLDQTDEIADDPIGALAISCFSFVYC